jgi:ankyrin repeat protein
LVSDREAFAEEASVASRPAPYDEDVDGAPSRSETLCRAAEGGHVDLVKLLLTSGADLEGVDQEGKTAHMISAERGHASVTEFLLVKGADLERVDILGRSALSNAAFQGQKAVVPLLLRWGADADTTDHFGQTPLMRAAEWAHGHHVDVIRALLAHGAAVDLRDKAGRTAEGLARHEDIRTMLQVRRPSLYRNVEPPSCVLIWGHQCRKPVGILGWQR